MGSQPSDPLHILLVSFPGQGHVNPLLRLAKRIASKGPLVTFSSSEDIGHKISSAAATQDSSAAAAAIPVGLGHLRFEFFSDGWPIDDPRRHNIDTLMESIRTAWPAAVAGLIRRQADVGRPVDCVVSNPFVPSVVDVAADMLIPCAVLWVQSCAVFSTYYSYHHKLVEFPTDDRPDVEVKLAGMPALAAEELPTFLLPSTPYVSLREAILEQFKNIHRATWVLANSFGELESDVVGAIAGFSPIRIIPVGPLVESEEEDSRSGISGDLLKAADCRSWLDAQEPLSVVYVSVGSIVVLSREEMTEMAYGLRDAGRPFLWVVREDCRNLLPDGFVEETEGRGMVVGWSPQELVLAHSSVACFVTHCGWNSTLEALTAGVPVVAYPQWGDQVTDAKFVTEVYGMGVWMKGNVEREELARCVREVTEGAAAEEMRKRAAGWKEAARAAVAEGGSSDRNIEAFVDEIRRRGCCGGGAGCCGEEEKSECPTTSHA